MFSGNIPLPSIPGKGLPLPAPSFLGPLWFYGNSDEPLRNALLSSMAGPSPNLSNTIESKATWSHPAFPLLCQTPPSPGTCHSTGLPSPDSNSRSETPPQAPEVGNDPVVGKLIFFEVFWKEMQGLDAAAQTGQIL